jgi:hypothetical protein
VPPIITPRKSWCRYLPKSRRAQQSDFGIYRKVSVLNNRTYAMPRFRTPADRFSPERGPSTGASGKTRYHRGIAAYHAISPGITRYHFPDNGPLRPPHRVYRGCLPDCRGLPAERVGEIGTAPFRSDELHPTGSSTIRGVPPRGLEGTLPPRIAEAHPVAGGAPSKHILPKSSPDPIALKPTHIFRTDPPLQCQTDPI